MTDDVSAPSDAVPTGVSDHESDGSDADRLLIVNADDFGLSGGVCTGILHAARHGVVTSTSALVTAGSFAAHAGALRDSGLPTGCHLAATSEDPPLLSAREIPTLVDRSGHLPRTWQAFLARAIRGAVDTADLRREFEAQLDLLGDSGIHPSHLDTHQNLHLWPPVARVVLDLARSRSIPAVRIPRSRRRTGVGPGVRLLSRVLVRRTDRAGIIHAADMAGLDEVGTLAEGALLDTIDRLARDGGPSAEIVMHLGREHDPDRPASVDRLRWADELAAACAPTVRRRIAEAGYRLASYRDLAVPEMATATPESTGSIGAPA